MKNLVCYYSLEGNTKAVAERIAAEIGADLLRLEPKEDVPREGGRKFLVGGGMATFGKGCELKPYNFDKKTYDRIILGTPVWAGKTVPAMNQFLTENDISDKVWAVFTLSGSGNDKKCIKQLRKTLPGIAAVATLYDPHMAKKEQSAQNEGRLVEFIDKLR